MTGGPERRRGVRITVPWHLGAPGSEIRDVRLVDLSPEGARNEHFEPLRDWSLCAIDLPRALGGARLMAGVVWSRVCGRKQDGEGEWRVYYRSGLAFRGLTSAQQTALTAALEIVETARDTLDSEPSG